MDNLYQQFKAVFPDAPLFVGTVQSVSGADEQGGVGKYRLELLVEVIHGLPPL